MSPHVRSLLKMAQLQYELAHIPECFQLCRAFLEKEIVALDRRLQSDVCVMIAKIFVPVAEYPRYNFMGRIVGPRGSTIQGMQAESGCRMQVRGKGTERPGQMKSDEEMHVVITYEGPREHGAASLACAERMVRKLLAPAQDDSQDGFKQAQLQQVAVESGKFLVNKRLTPCHNLRIPGAVEEPRSFPVGLHE